MNLKEAFRYQKFLSDMVATSCSYISTTPNCLNTTKTHLRSIANPDTEDMVEDVEHSADWVSPDLVVKFMTVLVDERDKLSKAIGAAKRQRDIDIDAAVETNKFRQMVSRDINKMCRCKAAKRKERGIGYKFNAEGNQNPYYYDIEITSEINFDKANAKSIARKMLADADKTSADIEFAMINAVVNYNPPFDINDGYEDVLMFFAENIHLF